MNKFVEGSYSSIKEVEQKVDTLLTQGYDKKNMTIVTDANTKNSLNTDIPVKTYGEDSDNDSMIDKIKDVFTGSDEDHTNDTDQKLLSDYETDLNNGGLVLLVEENKNAVSKTSDSTKAPDAEDAPILDPVNPGSDLVVDDNDDPSVDPAITPADHPDIDPTDPAHNGGETKQDTNSTESTKAPDAEDAPIIDPVNPGSDLVVDDNDDPSVDPAITPADHPDIDPTDPAHTTGKQEQYTDSNNPSTMDSKDSSESAGNKDQYNGKK